MFFPKLAANNIKKNRKTYLPYLLIGILSSADYYILCSLSMNPSLKAALGGSAMQSILRMGSTIAGFFVILFLLYASSFLMKQRQKEFAVLNILGMDKRHIAKVLGIEALYSFGIFTVGGLILGISLDKLTFLLFAKLIHADQLYGFFFFPAAAAHVVLLFFTVTLLIFAKSVWSLHILNPAELLRESKAGEREPKAKWLMALLGVLFLGSGYFLALTSGTPITALPQFFAAAILVILGTFLLFTAGSIALLKLLRKNRNFYYKTNHFISLSGLMYRMKQNAAGLASICILSTMVLVMLSSTGSLMMSLEQMLHERFPYDFNFEIYETEPARQQEILDNVHTLLQKHAVSVNNEARYQHLSFSAVAQGNQFYADHDSADQTILMLIPLSDYNRVTGEDKILQDNELLLYTKRAEWSHDTMDILGNSFSIKERIDAYPKNGQTAANIFDCFYLVCADDAFSQISAAVQSAYPDQSFIPQTFYGFDTDASAEEQDTLRTSIRELFGSYDFICENLTAERSSYSGLFSGMFFIGIFLALLFTMTTVLIIYYKQLSEGMDDKARFEILQKVGMSQKEVKHAIRSQVLTVFFLPLIFSGLHLAVAFPCLTKLLTMLGFTQKPLFATVTACAFLIFSLFYIIVYLFTAKVYYRIVKR